MNDEIGPTRVDDERAAAILERAAKLDAGLAREVDLGELREAALEAGISPGSFERALVEVSAGGAAESAEADHWTLLLSPLAPRRLLLAAGGLLLGSLPYLLGGWDVGSDAGLVFSFALALQILLFLIFRHRKDRTLADFEVDLTILWSTLTLALMLGDPRQAGDIAFGMSIVWLVSAVVGGLLVRVRGWWERDRPELPERI